MYRLRKIIKTLSLSVKLFTAKRVMAKAAALTYDTLLAIVPVLAVVFAIARGFGYNIYIEMWFRDALASQPQAAAVIIGWVNSYLVHTKSGIFLGVGLIFMLYTVWALVTNIEQTFNEIWQVRNSRSLLRTFPTYLAIFLLLPVMIVVATGISVFMSTMASKVTDILMLSSVVRLLISLSPYLLMSIVFIALYVLMPNTQVKVRHAIVPGIVAGVAMQWLQLFYIHSQLWVTGYNAIYGSFAALPLFMLWVQISWNICLFGAELTFTNQHLNRFGINPEETDFHPFVEMTDDERSDSSIAVYSDGLEGL